MVFVRVTMGCQIAFILLLASSTFAEVIMSVSESGGVLHLHNGLVDNWVAKGNFTDNIKTDGWSYLEVETNQQFPDLVQAYAAGFVEGASSAALIYPSWRNTFEGYCKWKGQKFCDDLFEFIRKNIAWMHEQIDENWKTSPYWYQVNLVLSQLSGVTDGYNSKAESAISDEDFLLMNLSGDLEDLEKALTPELHSMTLEQWVLTDRFEGDGHCSALVKLLPGNLDLYVSHVTWNSYQSMLRVLKKYIFPFQVHPTSEQGELIPGQVQSFSSYPGVILSLDDFHLLSSGLVTMETTIGNSNPALWKNIMPEGEVQDWIRVMVANRLANTGNEWCDIFSQYNSGTYNNQWMVVDYKQFKPGRAVQKDVLWVLEQLPGIIRAGDQSGILGKQSYWPSYNVPFFPEVFNASGLPAVVAKYGDWFTYDKTPRALIFRRDHDRVTDLGSMVRLMRYNDFKNDPLARCECQPPYSAENAISARNDLNPKNGTYPFGALGHRSHGGTDMKLTSSMMAMKMQFLAVSGPTYDQQPVFRWSKQDFAWNTPHYGHPDAWKFPVVRHKWVW